MRPKPLVFRLLRWSLLAVPLACNSLGGQTTPTTQVAPKPDPTFSVDARRAVELLASDAFEGRGIGTTGLDKSAEFIADAFKRLGLTPSPKLEGYFQPFSITAATAPDRSTSLKLGDKSYALNDDFNVVSFSAEKTFNAPVVFVGYGISSKEHDYNDYANVDVKGKIVLALRYEPHDERGVSRFTKHKDDWSDEATLMNKAEAAAKHGAAALLLVNPPTYHEDVSMPFANQFIGEKATLPFLHVKRHVADELLAKAGAKKLAELQAEIDTTGKPLANPLPNVAVSGNVKIRRTEASVKNVVGILPGKGELAGEFVVIGAHYDHLGKGGAGSLSLKPKEIHNGADDNASGTAAMLEMAEHYAKKGGHDGRSIVFVAFTAEEEGLIGSRRFVDHPPVPLDKIAYMLNLDMVGRVRNNILSIGGGGTAPGFEKMLKAADDASPLELKTLSKGGLGPSDHMSFAMKKIPVLFFFSGTHRDYHRPTDDADKVNYDGIDQVVKVGTSLIDAMTTHPREQYVSTSDHSGEMGGAAGLGSGNRKASLGVMPAYGAEAEHGVLIDEAIPGSAAEEAGLKGGDVIIQFGEEKLDSLKDLNDQLVKAKPGDKVKLVVVRDGKNVELTATLRERKG